MLVWCATLVNKTDMTVILRLNSQWFEGVYVHTSEQKCTISGIILYKMMKGSLS